MPKKIKGFYRYISRENGRFVSKGTTGEKRQYVSPDRRPRQSTTTGRFEPKTLPQSELNRASKSKFFIGRLKVGFGETYRNVYSIPFTVNRSGIEVSLESIQKAIFDELRKDEDSTVLALANIEIKEDRGTGFFIWTRVSPLAFANQNGHAKKLKTQIEKNVSSSPIKRLIEVQLQFSVPDKIGVPSKRKPVTKNRKRYRPPEKDKSNDKTKQTKRKRKR